MAFQRHRSFSWCHNICARHAVSRQGSFATSKLSDKSWSLSPKGWNGRIHRTHCNVVFITQIKTTGSFKVSTLLSLELSVSFKTVYQKLHTQLVRISIPASCSAILYFFLNKIWIYQCYTLHRVLTSFRSRSAIVLLLFLDSPQVRHPIIGWLKTSSPNSFTTWQIDNFLCSTFSSGI